jgi:hypothetical protein
MVLSLNVIVRILLFVIGPYAVECTFSINKNSSTVLKIMFVPSYWIFSTGSRLQKGGGGQEEVMLR